MSDTEILKGLECCSVVNPECRKCPYRDRYPGMQCEYALRSDAVMIITILKNKIQEMRGVCR